MSSPVGVQSVFINKDNEIGVGGLNYIEDNLDRLIALGVDLTVNGECPFCIVPCNTDWCAYTKEEDESTKL